MAKNKEKDDKLRASRNQQLWEIAADSKKSSSGSDTDSDCESIDSSASLSNALTFHSGRCAVDKFLEHQQKSEIEDTLLNAHLNLDNHLDGRYVTGMWIELRKFLTKDAKRTSTLANTQRQWKKEARKHWNDLKNASGTRQSSERKAYRDVLFADMAERLYARLDVLFSHRDETTTAAEQTPTPAPAPASVRSKTYFNQISRLDRKALTACLQVWRKSLRGCAKQYHGPIHSRWSTCREISHLFSSTAVHIDDTTLVYCPAVGKHWSEEADEIQIYENEESWTNVWICFDSLLQLRSTTVALVNKLQFDKVRETEHQSPSTSMDHGPLHQWGTMIAPPIAYTKDVRFGYNNRYVDVDFRGDDALLDSRHLINVFLRHSQSAVKAAKSNANERPSLLSMAAFKLNASGANMDQEEMDELPSHLKHLIYHVYRCTSCNSIVRPPVTYDVNPTSISKNFEHDAIQAGLDVHEMRKEMFVASIQAQAAWVPSFYETIVEVRNPFCSPPSMEKLKAEMLRRLLPNGRKGSYVQQEGRTPERIGGYFATQERDAFIATSKDEDLFSWRFCISCFASHVGVYHDEQVYCRCIACAYEAKDLQGDSAMEYHRFRLIP